MKQIEMATVLVALNGLLATIAIGCWSPSSVRAEAPAPRNGCVSREIVMRPIAEPQPMTTISGRIIAVEQNQNQRIAPKEFATWLRVKTNTGEEKSVYLGSNRSVKQQHLQLKVGDALEIQGVPMPKAKKPTIVASTIKKGDRVWKIENFTAKQVGVKSCRYNG
jgi:hypothetical protein